MLSSSARFASSRFLPARLGAIQPFSSLPVAPTAEQDPDAGINNVTIPEPQRTGVQASYKKGTGGRASFSGNVCTIFGTTGNIGKLIVGRLAKDGTQIIIPYRCDPYYIRHTKIQGELGQILFFPFDLKDENSIRKVLKYSNVVVNLIGRQNETKNYSFTDVHVDGARRLARLSREMGVERFIHFSALNATKNPEPHFIPGGSQFLRTKAWGEEAVREEFPNATIIRPAPMYEFQDHFWRYIVKWTRRTPSLKMHMYNFGEETFKMPIWQGDVAMGVQRIVNDPTLDGQTYEFVGPYSYTYHDLAVWLYRVYNQARVGFFNQGWKRGLSPWDQFMFNCTEFLKVKIAKSSVMTPIDWEFIERTECTSDALTGCPTLSDVGVKELHVIEYKLHPLIKGFGADFWHFIPAIERELPPHPPRYPPRYSEAATIGGRRPTVTGTASKAFAPPPAHSPMHAGNLQPPIPPPLTTGL